MSGLPEVVAGTMGREPVIAVRGRGIWSEKWYVNGPVLGSQLAITDEQLRGRRPLLLIDPEDGEQVEALLKRYHVESNGPAVERMQAALRSLAQPATPEPTGLGAVVRSGHGGVWVKWSTEHRADRNWKRHNAAGGDYAAWADIPQPVTILSAGWSE